MSWAFFLSLILNSMLTFIPTRVSNLTVILIFDVSFLETTIDKINRGQKFSAAADVSKRTNLRIGTLTLKELFSRKTFGTDVLQIEFGLEIGEILLLNIYERVSLADMIYMNGNGVSASKTMTISLVGVWTNRAEFAGLVFGGESAPNFGSVCFEDTLLSLVLEMNID